MNRGAYWVICCVFVGGLYVHGCVQNFFFFFFLAAFTATSSASAFLQLCHRVTAKKLLSLTSKSACVKNRAAGDCVLHLYPQTNSSAAHKRASERIRAHSRTQHGDGKSSVLGLYAETQHSAGSSKCYLQRDRTHCSH